MEEWRNSEIRLFERIVHLIRDLKYEDAAIGLEYLTSSYEKTQIIQYFVLDLFSGQRVARYGCSDALRVCLLIPSISNSVVLGCFKALQCGTVSERQAAYCLAEIKQYMNFYQLTDDDNEVDKVDIQINLGLDLVSRALFPFTEYLSSGTIDRCCFPCLDVVLPCICFIKDNNSDVYCSKISSEHGILAQIVDIYASINKMQSGDDQRLEISSLFGLLLSNLYPFMSENSLQSFYSSMLQLDNSDSANIANRLKICLHIFQISQHPKWATLFRLLYGKIPRQLTLDVEYLVEIELKNMGLQVHFWNSFLESFLSTTCIPDFETLPSVEFSSSDHLLIEIFTRRQVVDLHILLLLARIVREKSNSIEDFLSQCIAFFHHSRKSFAMEEGSLNVLEISPKFNLLMNVYNRIWSSIETLFAKDFISRCDVEPRIREMSLFLLTGESTSSPYSRIKEFWVNNRGQEMLFALVFGYFFIFRVNTSASLDGSLSSCNPPLLVIMLWRCCFDFIFRQIESSRADVINILLKMMRMELENVSFLDDKRNQRTSQYIQQELVSRGLLEIIKSFWSLFDSRDLLVSTSSNSDESTIDSLCENSALFDMVNNETVEGIFKELWKIWILKYEEWYSREFTLVSRNKEQKHVKNKRQNNLQERILYKPRKISKWSKSCFPFSFYQSISTPLPSVLLYCLRFICHFHEVNVKFEASSLPAFYSKTISLEDPKLLVLHSSTALSKIWASSFLVQLLFCWDKALFNDRTVFRSSFSYLFSCISGLRSSLMLKRSLYPLLYMSLKNSLGKSCWLLFSEVKSLYQIIHDKMLELFQWKYERISPVINNEFYRYCLPNFQALSSSITSSIEEDVSWLFALDWLLYLHLVSHSVSDLSLPKVIHQYSSQSKQNNSGGSQSRRRSMTVVEVEKNSYLLCNEIRSPMELIHEIILSLNTEMYLDLFKQLDQLSAPKSPSKTGASSSKVPSVLYDKECHDLLRKISVWYLLLEKMHWSLLNTIRWSVDLDRNMIGVDLIESLIQSNLEYSVVVNHHFTICKDRLVDYYNNYSTLVSSFARMDHWNDLDDHGSCIEFCNWILFESNDYRLLSGQNEMRDSLQEGCPSCWEVKYLWKLVRSSLHRLFDIQESPEDSKNNCIEEPDFQLDYLNQLSWSQLYEYVDGLFYHLLKALQGYYMAVQQFLSQFCVSCESQSSSVITMMIALITTWKDMEFNIWRLIDHLVNKQHEESFLGHFSLPMMFHLQRQGLSLAIQWHESLSWYVNTWDCHAKSYLSMLSTTVIQHVHNAFLAEKLSLDWISLKIVDSLQQGTSQRTFVMYGKLLHTAIETSRLLSVQCSNWMLMIRLLHAGYDIVTSKKFTAAQRKTLRELIQWSFDCIWDPIEKLMAFQSILGNSDAMIRKAAMVNNKDMFPMKWGHPTLSGRTKEFWKEVFREMGGSSVVRAGLKVSRRVTVDGCSMMIEFARLLCCLVKWWSSRYDNVDTTTMSMNTSVLSTTATNLNDTKEFNDSDNNEDEESWKSLIVRLFRMIFFELEKDCQVFLKGLTKLQIKKVSKGSSIVVNDGDALCHLILTSLWYQLWCKSEFFVIFTDIMKVKMNLMRSNSINSAIEIASMNNSPWESFFSCAQDCLFGLSWDDFGMRVFQLKSLVTSMIDDPINKLELEDSNGNQVASVDPSIDYYFQENSNNSNSDDLHATDNNDVEKDQHGLDVSPSKNERIRNLKRFIEFLRNWDALSMWENLSNDHQEKLEITPTLETTKKRKIIHSSPFRASNHRSRNIVIDEWLVEDREAREDFSDLEDFVVP